MTVQRLSDLAPFKPAQPRLCFVVGLLGHGPSHHDGGLRMSKAKWNPSPAREAVKLIKLAESKGYEVTQIEINDGNVRLGVRRPGSATTIVSEADELRKNL
jgi:hypothetical protein